jgi:ABC-type Fe3+/spermidine/putrescine transport system ATPase subunit
VTHDQEEAFDLSDRVAVMSDGELRQVGTPEELYDHPHDAFVAGFVGRANTLSGVLESPQGGALSVRLAGDARWPVDPERTGGLEPGQAVRVVVRPEDLELVEEGHHAAELGGVVSERAFRGARLAYFVTLADGAVVEIEIDRQDAARGGRIAVQPRSHARVHVYPVAE